MISPLQSHYHEGSPMSKEVKLRWVRFVEEVGFSLEWKSEGVMDAESCSDDKYGLTSEWGGESKQD